MLIQFFFSGKCDIKGLNFSICDKFAQICRDDGAITAWGPREELGVKNGYWNTYQGLG
jgi:hypothetical protein